MNFEVLPGPSLAELARTAVASAPAATVSCGSPAGGGSLAGSGAAGADESAGADECLEVGASPEAGASPVTTVVMRAGPAGQPVLLPADGSVPARWLAGRRGLVTVSVPAAPPFSALRLRCTVRPGRAAGPPRHDVALLAAEFAGASPAPVPLAQYRAAEPDPLWRQAPGILRHLGDGHMAELVACARAHGLRDAEWVTLTSLDRFGLKLLVFTLDGITEARLSFPDGPVTSFSQVPASLRAVLACRCQAPRDGEPGGLGGVRASQEGAP
jgi:hypothetical protein